MSRWLEYTVRRGASVAASDLLPRFDCGHQVLQIPEGELHLELGVREIEAILEVCALTAVLPGVCVDIELAVAMAGAESVDGDLEHFAGDWLSELETLQVGVNGAEAGLHDFLGSRSIQLRRR